MFYSDIILYATTRPSIAAKTTTDVRDSKEKEREKATQEEKEKLRVSDSKPCVNLYLLWVWTPPSSTHAEPLNYYNEHLFVPVTRNPSYKTI